MSRWLAGRVLMGTNPYQVRPLTQVNTTDGGLAQRDAQISAAPDGGYVVRWTDHTPVYGIGSGTAMLQRYNVLGDMIGSEIEVRSTQFDPEPSVAVLPSGVVLCGLRFTYLFGRGLIADIYDSSLNFTG